MTDEQDEDDGQENDGQDHTHNDGGHLVITQAFTASNGAVTISHRYDDWWPGSFSCSDSMPAAPYVKSVSGCRCGCGCGCGCGFSLGYG